MPKPLSRSDEAAIAAKAKSGDLARDEQAIDPVTVEFNHFEYPGLRAEKVGEEVIVVMRGYVTEVTGTPPKETMHLTPNTTRVRFSRSSLIKGSAHGGGARLENAFDSEDSK